MAELLPSFLPNTLPISYFRNYASVEHDINCFNLQNTASLTSEFKAFVDFSNADDNNSDYTFGQ